MPQFFQISKRNPPHLGNAGPVSCRLIPIIIVLAFILIAMPSSGSAATLEAQDYLNYAYATWIGTGYYKTSDRTIWVLRVPISLMLMEPDKEKKRKWALELKLPVTVGFEQFEEIPESIGAVAFVPGLELHYPVLKNWWLKPYIQLGLGKDFSGGGLALIYAAGLRSLTIIPWKKFDFSIGANLMGARQTISGSGSDNGFSMIEAGLDIRHPIPFNFRGRNTDLSGFFVFTEFIDDLDIIYPGSDEVRVQRLYKFGLTMGFDKPLSIWFVKIPRVGIDFITGEGIKSIGLNMGFPF
jgi:hypothetical protein